MTAEEILVSLEDEFENDIDYAASRVAERILRQICVAMDEQGITQSELARRLDVSRQHISAFMSDPGNPTVRTVVEMASAVGLSVTVELRSEIAHIAADTTWGRAQSGNWAAGTAIVPARGGIPFDDIPDAA